jgi:hypothetical protein
LRPNLNLSGEVNQAILNIRDEIVALTHNVRRCGIAVTCDGTQQAGDGADELIEAGTGLASALLHPETEPEDPSTATLCAQWFSATLDAFIEIIRKELN